MKTNLTIADRALGLLNEPAGRIAAGLHLRAAGTQEAKKRSTAVDHLSPFVGLDLQLAATTKPSNAAVRHNHFRAAILALQGAEAVVVALGDKVSASSDVPLTVSDLKSLGPKMRAAAEALEAAVGDGTHPRDAAALYQALGGLLNGVADRAGWIGIVLGHKAEIAQSREPEHYTARATEFWQNITQGEPKLAKELSLSLSQFYASADRVLRASTKLLHSADTTSTLMQPVSLSFAHNGLWVDAEWSPKDYRLELSVGGHPVASALCTGDTITELLYTSQLPTFARNIEVLPLRDRLIDEQVNRNGASGAPLTRAFENHFGSQADIDKAAKAAHSTFAPIKVNLDRSDTGQAALPIEWDPLWGVLRVDGYDYPLKHPGAKDAWAPGYSGVSQELILQALQTALAERPGDTSQKALERARLACGIASPK